MKTHSLRHFTLTSGTLLGSPYFLLTCVLPAATSTEQLATLPTMLGSGLYGNRPAASLQFHQWAPWFHGCPVFEKWDSHHPWRQRVEQPQVTQVDKILLQSRAPADSRHFAPVASLGNEPRNRLCLSQAEPRLVPGTRANRLIQWDYSKPYLLLHDVWIFPWFTQCIHFSSVS